jgi:hypothetical protein
MKNRNYCIVVLASLLLIMTSLAQATTSVSQVNVNSNATCSSVVTNAILMAKVTSVPSAGGLNSLSVDGQVFEYSISSSNGVTGNTLGSWTTKTNSPNLSVKPVNFVILKTSNNTGDSDNSGNNGGRAFLFGNLGVITDDNEIAPAKIIGITFCALASPVAQGLTQCTTCPPENDPDIKARIVTQFDEPTDPKKGWQVRACACGQFKECNPALPVGTSVPDGIPGPCAGPLPFLPIDVTVGGESYYCTVINGSRRCYAKK